MKVTIICSSLEPAQDGVGDYSRLLAESAQHLGHSIQLISINDHVNSSESQPYGSLHRFSGDYSDAQIAAKITNEIDQWTPDCVSLQFVPFGFHPKGIISKLIPFISTIRKNRTLNIMMHELWIRNEEATPLKHRLLGLLQKRQITRALRTWSPDTIHTSNHHYQNLLKASGHTSQLLPLYGNIPIAPAPDKAALLEALNLQIAPTDKIVLFPFSQHERWEPITLLDRLQEISKKEQANLALIQIGRSPTLKLHWPQIAEYANSVGWKCAILGEQSDTRISELMQISDGGISAGSALIARKSGAVLSMLEHGLPVLCSSAVYKYDWHDFSEPSILAAEEPNSQIHARLWSKPRAAPESKRQQITDQWLSDLQLNSNGR